MELKTIVKIITMIDVLLAAVLITVYVSILSNHIEELQLEKRSKGEHVLLYIYVCVSILVQLFFAFQFYRVILFSYHDEDDDEHQHGDVQELLRIAKYWTIASYLILLNFVIKTGVYSQRCRCVISLTLGIYVFAIFFRICAIFTVRSFITKLEKLREEIQRKEKLRIIMGLHQFRP